MKAKSLDEQSTVEILPRLVIENLIDEDLASGKTTPKMYFNIGEGFQKSYMKKQESSSFFPEP